MTVDQVRLFGVHAQELLDWNQRVNLTALSEMDALAERQFLDVIPLAGMLPQGWHVLDLGSGGGFPGIPLKILRPDLRVSLVDGIRKKTNFLKHLTRVLGLTDVSVRQMRAETMVGHDSGAAGGWDVVVSKAVGPPERLADLCGALVRCGGWIVVMAGMPGEGEELRIPGFSIRQTVYRLPFEGVERRLVVLEKGWPATAKRCV